MLILTRRVDENLTIGDDVVISILGVKGNQVRLSIRAPRELPVHREEIYERIRRGEGVITPGPAAPRGDGAVAAPGSVPTIIKRRRAVAD